MRGPNDFHVCDCPAADAAAIDAKLAAEAAGTEIFAIHFDDGGGFTCPDEPGGGMAFMLTLASTPAMFFEGTDDLPALSTTFNVVSSVMLDMGWPTGTEALGHA